MYDSLACSICIPSNGTGKSWKTTFVILYTPRSDIGLLSDPSAVCIDREDFLVKICRRHPVICCTAQRTECYAIDDSLLSLLY